MIRFHVSSVFLLLAGPIMGWAGPAVPRGPGEPIAALASIPPQKYIVERVGGDAVRVSVVVRPGESPATYEPKPSQLKEAAAAEVYFAIDVPFEWGWGRRIRGMFPRLRWVDTTQEIDRLASDHAYCGAHHGDGPGETLDPHVWLSPRRVAIMAATIAEALSEIRPERQEAFQCNLDDLERDIRQLDEELSALLAPASNRTFLVYHPSWGYFAADYGLRMLAIEQGGQEPSAFEMATVLREARAHGVRDIFVQPEFSTQSARAVANELGGRVVVLSPLAEDWLSNLRRVGAAIAQSLGVDPAAPPVDGASQ